MEKWQNKIAVVTGASGGIGSAICRELVKHGMIVCGFSRHVERVEQVRASLFNVPGTLRPVDCDIRDEESVKIAFRWIDRTYGGADVLVNNAAVISKSLITDDGNTDELYEVNACVPGTKPMNAMYPATKFAVTAITECLRQELLYLDTEIKVSSISPGLVDSEIVKKATDLEMIKFMPKLKPEDVADAVIFVLTRPPHVQIQEVIIKPVGEFL